MEAFLLRPEEARELWWKPGGHLNSLNFGLLQVLTTHQATHTNPKDNRGPHSTAPTSRGTPLPPLPSKGSTHWSHGRRSLSLPARLYWRLHICTVLTHWRLGWPECLQSVDRRVSSHEQCRLNMQTHTHPEPGSISPHSCCLCLSYCTPPTFRGKQL